MFLGLGCVLTCLVSTERKEGYDFLIKSFNEIHTEVGAREPSVAITDFEDALRASIMEALPATQLQLCIFHINANVDKYVRRRWQGDGGAPADEYDVNPDKEAAEAEVAAAAKAAQEAREAEAAILNDPQAQALNEVVRANRVLSRRQLDALVVDHTPTGFTELWAYVMYADTEDFNAAWARLQEEFADREPTLDYLRSTYFPLRHQWAQCFISEYENYGVRTNSPTETAHKDLKSYVITGHSDLLGVSQAIDEMLRNKERTYCRGRFTHQFKLPCSHKILELEKDGEKLTIYDVNPRFELTASLTSQNLIPFCITPSGNHSRCSVKCRRMPAVCFHCTQYTFVQAFGWQLTMYIGHPLHVFSPRRIIALHGTPSNNWVMESCFQHWTTSIR
ncbi:hypothetical protein K456DRAFT_1309647 [Colletotrichum gloeosporioides 23]|nr:hypothetical protein K456DRAFT_1309647 [Colletotrichum gloeosporioides 23]